MRSYNSKHFKLFAKMLKERGLWRRYRMFEYYYRYYLEGSSIYRLMKCLEEPEYYIVGYEEENMDNKYPYFEGLPGCSENYVLLSSFFEHFRV